MFKSEIVNKAPAKNVKREKNPNELDDEVVVNIVIV